MDEKLEQALPGVTLTLRSVREYRLGVHDRADVTLSCGIEDREIWEHVMSMLKSGYRIYTQEDFKGEMLNVVKTEVHQLEKRIEMLTYERDRQIKENVLLREELEKKRDILDVFGRRLQE